MKISLKYIVVCLGVVSIASSASAELVDKVLAVVNSNVITLYELRQAEQQYRAEGIPLPETPAERQQQMLKVLIENELMGQEVEESGILVSEEELNAALDDIKTRNQLTSNEQLKNIVHQQGQTWDEFLEDIRKQIKMAKLVNREVRSRVEVSEDAVQEYYQAHRDQFSGGDETIHVRHILLKVAPEANEDETQAVRARALEVVEQLRDGADFATMAQQYSEDPSAQRGGELGTFKQGELAPPFDAAFHLDEGEISDPVKSEFGFHILTVDQRTSADQDAYEQARRRIRQMLYEKRFNELYQQWITDLKEAAYIEIIQ